MKAMSWGQFITSKVDGHVLVVTIDKPPFNHVSVDLMSDLASCLEAGDREPRIRASVIQADGKAFCAGADFASPTDAVGSGMVGINALYTQGVRLFSIEKPIVAAVQGAAVGAGL